MSLRFHGVDFIGFTNVEEKRLLFRISQFTTRGDWRGIKFVYKGRNQKQTNQEHIGAFYVPNVLKRVCKRSFNKLPNGETLPRVSSHITKPYIVIFNVDLHNVERVNKENLDIVNEHTFVFRLFHELGHHHDLNLFYKSHIRQEIDAHKYALSKTLGFFKQSLEVVKPMYLTEAIEEWKSENHYTEND